ncbi:50S ribosomal protein L24e [Candidatus Pacearchaeota archaeon CG_4_9_14_0_2_um_filter_39_13]|nr:50S ribosomal protein L24e [Candidatus Pacearchaeota archaeon]OIO44038.1 MAG: hypothetical protein AUJ64_00790 [Candidatus Pacearchaeota archaeon CG1_02_39_14]PJC44504.1 MAG: 50S ribosomal protein L24e [Candidatus Pacearchaeota archaeon CG_4_9_14_0_2_um_filter_39_13]QBM01499.1 hypothetical protein [uncultured archaeon]
MAKCVFCGREQDDYKGTFLMKNDGTINYYCSNKCQKNHLKLKRDRRKIKWTEAFYKARDKRITKERERVEKVRAKKAERSKDSDTGQKSAKKF